VETFVLLKERNRIPGLKLKAAGTAAPMDQPYIEGLETRLSEAGLGEDFQFLPNLSRQEKIEFLRSLTVFSVPAVYQEAFGLYLLEAMACGVPVVQPRRGAFPEILEATGGGILTESDDPQEMADAIENLFLGEEERTALGGRGRQAVFEKFSAERMAKGVLSVCEEELQRSD
jgi:glycosyltransferase involved in cell wall biosynthesis